MKNTFELPTDPPGKEVNVIRPTDTCLSAAGLQVLREAHDARVYEALAQVFEYREDHPGLIKSITLQVKTWFFFTPADARQALDKVCPTSSGNIQVLKEVCGGDVMAAIVKESSIGINTADAE